MKNKSEIKRSFNKKLGTIREKSSELEQCNCSYLNNGP
jgi:hypothetical protein